MPPAKDGVRKQAGFYSKSVQKLEAVVEQKLKQLASLERQRSCQAEREQVLVDLVLQQEHHLEHLSKVKASRDADMAELNELLNICGASLAEPLVLPASSPHGTMCTASQASAALTTDVASNTGASCSTSITQGFAQLLEQQQQPQQQVQEAFLQAQRQQQPMLSRQHSVSQGMPLLKEQVKQQQQQTLCSLSTNSKCRSDTPGAPIGIDSCLSLNSNQSQHMQRLMKAALPCDWDRAMSMKSEDWSNYFIKLSTRLKTVMQLRQQKRDASAAAEIMSADSKRQALQEPPLDSQFIDVSPEQRTAIMAVSLQPEGPPADFVDPDTELVALVDDFYTLVNLSILHNPLPVRDCARRNQVTREYNDVVPLVFWAEVNAKTGFSEEQMCHLRIGYAEFWQMLGQVHSKQQQLANSVEASTAASAPTPWGMREGTSSAAMAAAVTAPAQQRDNLLQLLDEHMARWQTAAQLLLQFYCNTMTHEQAARMLIETYPYFPRMGSLVGAIAEADEPGAFQRLETHMNQFRLQHAQAVNRRKLQLEKQRQEYWRRLVVLREQQQQQQTQQQQQQEAQPRFVMQPLTLHLL